MRAALLCRYLWKKRWLRVLLITVCLCLVFVLFNGIAFISTCNNPQNQFKPIASSIEPETLTVEQSINGYKRTEETTYLTFPEWYLVFNPQEYAKFLLHNRPSQFPYFSSIKQFWYGYCQVYSITTNNYEFNAGDHAVEVVIGTSFSLEYLIKGVYENTLGKISEFTANGEQVQEDHYAAKIAKEYGDFIPTEPWYAFPFGKALRGVWADTDLWGPHLIRKWERKIFLSLEYGIKSVYAKLIGLGTHATFGIADTEIYAHIANVPESIFSNEKVRMVKELEDGSEIIALPHYQGFTDEVPGLAKQGLQFLDLAGNDEILATVVAPIEWEYNLSNGKELFTMSILTDKKLKRVAIQVPVEFLSDMLNQLNDRDIKIEHLFDY